jgi:hypothetical protein
MALYISKSIVDKNMANVRFGHFTALQICCAQPQPKKKIPSPHLPQQNFPQQIAWFTIHRYFIVHLKMFYRFYRLIA